MAVFPPAVLEFLLADSNLSGAVVSLDVRSPWVQNAEEAIRALRDVESASVQSEGDTIREIHVLSRSNRPPKQIVRDVQTVLQTRFNRSIDYRVVSVAYLSGPSTAPPPAAPAPRDAPAPDAPPVAGPAPSASPQAPPASAAAPRAVPEEAPRPVEGERIRFGSVNLFVSGPRTQAQVELRWRGLPRMGSAS